MAQPFVTVEELPLDASLAHEKDETADMSKEFKVTLFLTARFIILTARSITVTIAVTKLWVPGEAKHDNAVSEIQYFCSHALWPNANGKSGTLARVT